jgi:hypothetical protein
MIAPHSARHALEKLLRYFADDAEVHAKVSAYIQALPEQELAEPEVDNLIKAGRAVVSYTQASDRPPVRDALESGRMTNVRLHAVADLFTALLPFEERELNMARPETLLPASKGSVNLPGFTPQSLLYRTQMLDADFLVAIAPACETGNGDKGSCELIINKARYGGNLQPLSFDPELPTAGRASKNFKPLADNPACLTSTACLRHES